MQNMECLCPISKICFEDENRIIPSARWALLVQFAFMTVRSQSNALHFEGAADLLGINPPKSMLPSINNFERTAYLAKLKSLMAHS
jgi:hypothetical protein